VIVNSRQRGGPGPMGDITP